MRHSQRSIQAGWSQVPIFRRHAATYQADIGNADRAAHWRNMGASSWLEAVASENPSSHANLAAKSLLYSSLSICEMPMRGTTQRLGLTLGRIGALTFDYLIWMILTRSRIARRGPPSFDACRRFSAGIASQLSPRIAGLLKRR